MKELEQYVGRKLTPDEHAIASNLRDKFTKELEDMEFETGEDYILLKWGTLKGWSLHSKKGKQLLEEYNEIGSSMSAMLQKDTDRQKEIICQMIDECDGSIQSDWTGEHFTKAQAKEYVMDHKNS